VEQTYRVLSGLIALGVLVQAAAIAFGWFDGIHELDNGLVVDENSEGNAGHLVHAASLSQLRRHIDVAGRTRRNHHVLGRTSVTHEELDGFGRLAGAFVAELERKFR
jgi:hypothetical protein